MMKKRIVSLGLAAMMTAGLFAGCGNSSESQGDSTASGSKSDDIVTLKWVTIGSGMPDNYDSWVKKVNDYVGEKIGVNSVCSLSNLFFRFHTTTLTEACSNELKQHHL